MRPDRLEVLHGLDPYGLDASAKDTLYCELLGELVRHHYYGSEWYQAVMDAYGLSPEAQYGINDVPYIPVRLFKEAELLSVARESIVKTMTSSGTSGQAVSKVLLDKENAKAQTKTLSHIMASFIGKGRLPLLILDTEQVKRDRSMFSARGAGIIGFCTFGVDVTYALDSDMNIDVDAIHDFFDRHVGQRVLMFGYTYMVWQYVVEALRERGVAFGFDDAILFHIGGWKKLKDKAVSAAEYNRSVGEVLGNVRVYNYYGMAEQLGSVFVECEKGHMHCSIYSDVLVRRPEDFTVAGIGERGYLELVSLLPSSYPGHAILTEDEGEVLGVDDCPCGRLGRYFKIHGRMPGAEIRGCSDTHERR